MSKHYRTTNTNNTASSGGIGVLGVLQIIFIVLKVLDMISWSWWTVFIPTFIGLGIGFLVWLIAMIVIIVTYVKESEW
jgi:hypothetical protein